MAAYDDTKQKMIMLAGMKKEVGGGVTIDGVSSQSFTVATKLRKVIKGSGVMDTDGMVAVAVPGLTSNGQATFKRTGDIETSADTISYELHGH